MGCCPIAWCIECGEGSILERERQHFIQLRLSAGTLTHKGRLTREKQSLLMCATGITQKKPKQKVTQSGGLAPRLMKYIQQRTVNL